MNWRQKKKKTKRDFQRQVYDLYYFKVDTRGLRVAGSKHEMRVIIVRKMGPKPECDEIGY